MERFLSWIKKYRIAVMAAVAVIIVASVGIVYYVSADNSFTFSINMPYTFEGNSEIDVNVGSITNFPSGSAYYPTFISENNKFKVDSEGNNVDVGFIWEAVDPYDEPVFEFTNTSKGFTCHLKEKGAGTSYLSGKYYDFVLLDEDGNVINYTDSDFAAKYNRTDTLTAVSSNTLTIFIPLKISTLTYTKSGYSSSNTLLGSTILDVNDSITIPYNGYIKELSGTYYNDIDKIMNSSVNVEELNAAHTVRFSYNPNVLNDKQIVTSSSVNSQFTVIGGGMTKIDFTVGDLASPEQTGKVTYDSVNRKIYVGVDITPTEMTINQYENIPFTSANTNIKDGNFGYTDEDGEYSVYFWTLEDFQREMLGNTDVIDVVDVSDSGVMTGKYAGLTTVYASCKPMSESYSDPTNINSLKTDIADSVQVRVPFVKYFDDNIIVSVGDNIPVITSAYIENVTYSMYNNSGAIDAIDGQKGMYYAKQAGTAEIHMTAGIYENGQKVDATTNPIKIYVTVIDKLTLDKSSASVNVGFSTSVTAIPSAVEGAKVSNVSWKSADPSIAVVTYDDSSYDSCLRATVTGVAKGKTTITATQTIDGVVKIAVMEINVTVPVDGISLSEPQNGADHLTMYFGETKTVFAYIEYSNGDVPDNTELIWTISGDQLISITPVDTEGVTQSCTITAVGIGQTTLTCYSSDSNKIVTCDIVITEQPTGITLSETNVVAYMSLKQYQLKAYVESPNDGADQTVIWSSLNENVVKVDPNTGLVTLVAPGSTYVVATSAVDPGVTAYCYFEVAQDVTDIEIDATELTLNVGDTYRLTTTIIPDNAYDKTVIWTTSNPNVVEVENTNSYENLLTAVGPGSATVLAKTNDGGYICYCNIRVLQPVTSITISDSEMTVRKGTVFYLNATPLPSTADDKTIVWSSNDTSIATVSSEGRVDTLSVGQCTITATNPASGQKVSCIVTVLEPVTGLTLNTYYQNMVKDTRFVLIPTVEPLDASNKSVTYWSSDEDVATVDENGVVIARNGGTCEIVVTTVESQLSAKCTIVVKEYVSSIELADSFMYVNKGDTKSLEYVVGAATATDKSLVWTSSNTNIATVDEKGNITGVEYGTAIITATSADGSGVSASCVVQVIRPVTEIVLDKQKVTMYVGDVIHISATIKPADATVQKLQWTSTDPAVARVYDDGDVEAMSVGRCKIICMSTDGNDIIAECTIIVKQIVQATSLSINSDEILMLTGKTRKLSVRLYPTNSSETVNWMSTDTSVVTVDPDGQITTVGPGDCYVVAYTTYGTVEDRCHVYSMAMSKSSIQIEQYDTFNLYVDGSPYAASWRTSNPRIATVTQNGVVTGRMPGECTISATVDGKTVNCYVKVMAVDPGKFINSEDKTHHN